ncbi:MAG TPA: DUF3108 domain-containing protein [Nitrospirota bacterium]|nr:DUF3108 domain-containing protein [Nitrospirota bacterium]
MCSLALGLLLLPGAFRAEEQAAASLQPQIEALKPGEILTYDISWSRIVTAGIAIMETREGTLPDGKQVLRFIATTHSAGLVDIFYRVNDRLESVYDPGTMRSLTFSLNQSHGKEKKRRELVFDHANKTVISTLNDDPPVTIIIPDQVQDALSSLYYLRTRDDFIVGKAIIIYVHDSGKNWSVEAQTLGREKVKTPAGEFATIKVRTFPTYEGVFMNKGDIFIWLTDDSRKIPVLMKSTISIGSIVTTLTKMDPGKDIQ